MAKQFHTHTNAMRENNVTRKTHPGHGTVTLPNKTSHLSFGTRRMTPIHSLITLVVWLPPPPRLLPFPSVLFSFIPPFLFFSCLYSLFSLFNFLIFALVSFFILPSSCFYSFPSPSFLPCPYSFLSFSRSNYFPTSCSVFSFISVSLPILTMTSLIPFYNVLVLLLFLLTLFCSLSKQHNYFPTTCSSFSFFNVALSILTQPSFIPCR